MDDRANPYFGKAWNPNIAASHPQAETPVGVPCSYCDEGIEEGDQGFLIPHGHVLRDEDGDGTFDKMEATIRPIHLDCFLRQIFGSVGHLSGKCSCFGGTEEDPPGMTRRQAAQAAVRLRESMQGVRQ